MLLALALATVSVPVPPARPQAGAVPEPLASSAVQAALGGDTDWVVLAGVTTVFDTSSSVVNGKLVLGGVVGVHDFHVQPGAVLRIQGPNPFVLTASGQILIEGLIDISGTSSPGVVTLNTTYIPLLGAPGQGGGGRGGTGSPQTTSSSFEGGAGQGAFASGLGGGFGGETGWANASVKEWRRGAGGGGGRFGPDVADQSRIGLDAEPGFDNLQAENGALSGAGPAHGGAVGRSPFEDGDPGNDFFGLKLEHATGALVTGELRKPWAGAGGGGGGDAARVPLGQSFPAVPFSPGGDERGAGGGGGGGSLHLLALGPIAFGPAGQIKARGGSGGGGENTIFLDRVGGGSGGGSGGHLVLESASRIDFSASQGNALIATGGQGGAGQNDVGGAFLGGSGVKETKPKLDACPPGATGCLGHVDGAGGDGSPGLIQLHVPPADGASGKLVLPPGVSLAELCFPLPVAAGTGSQLLPTFEAPGAAPLFGALARRLTREDLRFRPRLGFGLD